jgi:estrogen-related receptor beta like 1
LEVERVTPQLKVTVANNNRDWRVHLQQLRKYTQTIHQLHNETKAQFAKLDRDVEMTMEKITSREAYINQQFEELASTIKVEQERLIEARQQCDGNNATVTELSDELNRVSDRLDVVKSEIDDLGSGMTDPKPLVNIKNAAAKLKAEIKDMNVRIGIAQHTVFRHQIKEQSSLMMEMARTKVNVSAQPKKL